MEFITWWYGRGYAELLSRISSFMKRLWMRFSVPTLAKTLFEPWRRITSDYGKSIQEKFRALLDNTVSRFVGLLIRISVIITAFIVMLLIVIAAGIILVLWPLAPLLIIGVIVWAVL
jgi:hypothetical protein